MMLGEQNWHTFESARPLSSSVGMPLSLSSSISMEPVPYALQAWVQAEPPAWEPGSSSAIGTGSVIIKTTPFFLVSSCNLESSF